MWKSDISMIIKPWFDCIDGDNAVQKPCVTRATEIWKTVMRDCIFLLQSLQKFWKQSKCDVSCKSCQGRYNSRKHQVSKYMIARKYMNKIRCFRLFCLLKTLEFYLDKKGFPLTFADLLIVDLTSPSKPGQALKIKEV